MKTVIQNLIGVIEDLKSREVELTTEGILTMLGNIASDEKEQILNAFNEGMKYGNSPLQTFDYPASKYYSGTYDNDENK